MKTSKELVEYAKSLVGSPYVYGVNGRVVTEELIKIKAKQYPKLYTQTYITKARKFIGKVAYDCSGLIDTFLGVDLSADGYYASAQIKGTTLKDMPDQPGILIHSSAHIGVYIGNGKVVEARGIDYGVVITNLHERGWVRWSKCHLLDYNTSIVPIIQKRVNPYKFPTITLYKNNKKMTKEDVKWLQFQLSRVYGTAVDGSFGEVTHRDLLKFQSNFMKTPDGMCGPVTKSELLKI